MNESATSLPKGQRWRRISVNPPFLAVVFLIGFGTLLIQFFFNLWRFEIYQFFPLAVAGAALLARRGCEETTLPLRPGKRAVTYPLSILFLALLAYATLLYSPWFGILAALLALVTTAWWLGGVSLLRSLTPTFLMLLTVIPPPLNLDSRLALLLQRGAVTGSSWILAIFGVPHLRNGNVLEIPGQRLLVEEACSGINSVLFMTSACVFYALWRRRSFQSLALLYLLTLGCVLLGNLVRITSGAFLLFNFHIDLFTGWRHEALGLLLMTFYLLFIPAEDILITRFVPTFASTRLWGTPQNVINGGTRRSLSSVIHGAFEGYQLRGGFRIVVFLLVAMGILQLIQAWDSIRQEHHERRINPAWMDGSAKFSLPPQIGQWTLRSALKPIPKKTAFESGVYSHQWEYEWNGMTALISLDYPFYDYHDVRSCYSKTGWTVENSQLHRAEESADEIPSMEVQLAREDGIKGVLHYSTVDELGNWIEENSDRSYTDNEGHSFWDGGLIRRIGTRTNRERERGRGEATTLNYRIQVLAISQGGLETIQSIRLERLFDDVRLLLADQFVIKEVKTKPDQDDVMILPSILGGSGAKISLPTTPKTSIAPPEIQQNSFGKIPKQ
jgi:exosortase